jgi:hypothetical protein
MNENWKEQIEGVSEMATIWGISPHYLKRLCHMGRIDCKKIGNTWVIYKNQPKPDIKHYNWKEDSKI